MTESRPILELLQLMVENKDEFYSSLCSFAFKLRLDDIISKDEEIIILTYIKQNTPDHVKCPNNYYWPIGEIQPRFTWLNQQIELLKQSNQFGEFKGTSGEWSLPHFASNYNAKEEDGFKCDCGYVLADNKYFGAVCEVFYSSDQKLENGDNPPLEEAIYNALLISKAPKMLEMLKSCKLAFEQLGMNEPIGITELIKEATEL